MCIFSRSGAGSPGPLNEFVVVVVCYIIVFAFIKCARASFQTCERS